MEEKDILDRLDRIASGIEKLAEDPVIHVESGPPVCPSCGQDNPVIRSRESEATGKLGDFIIQATCLHCDNVFWALPLMWQVVSTIEEANDANTERADRHAGKR